MHSGKERYNGFVIVLAWPETYCKQPGAWYDGFMNRLGVSKNFYYRAGHAALILIDAKNPTCHYFDFGRYHAPFNHGRVRAAFTDDDLVIKTDGVISCDGGHIENYRDILTELQSKKAFHGDGLLYSSWHKINFNKAFAFAKKMQERGAMRYGPFEYNGSNCSRFVNAVLLNAGLPLWNRFKLKFMVPLTPTPMNNVNALRDKRATAKYFPNKATYPDMVNQEYLLSTLFAPPRHKNIPGDAQWLSGEGAGSWFHYQHVNDKIIVTRYAPDGTVECKGLYKNHKDYSSFDDQQLKFDFPSNCKQVSLIIEDQKVLFDRVSVQ